MIHIYRADSEVGVALFDLVTGKFLYGELCNSERLIKFVNNFPEHPVTIFVERGWKEEIEEVFFLLPHLQDIATVKTVRKVSPKQMLIKDGKNKPKLKPGFLCVCIGVMLGCLLLIPTSFEYRDSVLTKAKSVETMTEEFVQNQPDKQSVQQLYTSISGVYSKANVEAVTYSAGTFKIVFSSVNGELQSSHFDGFEKATLTKVASLEDGKGATVHVYEMEGSL